MPHRRFAILERVTSPLRTTSSFVLGLAGCLLAVVALVTVWGKAQVLDTDRFVAGVAPLAQDAAIRERVSDVVSTALLREADSAGLPTALRSTVARAVRSQTADFVRSDSFARLWAQTNRTLQTQTVDVLLTGRSRAATLQRGSLVIDLSAVADAVRTQVLGDVPGLDDLPGLVQALPSITLRLPLASAERVQTAGSVARWVDRWAYPAAVGSLVLLVLSVVVASRRLRALAWIGIGLAVAMAVVWLAVRAGAGPAASRLPAALASDGAGAAYYGAVTGSLQHDAVMLGIAAVVLAVGGALGASVTGRART